MFKINNITLLSEKEAETYTRTETQVWARGTIDMLAGSIKAAPMPGCLFGDQWKSENGDPGILYSADKNAYRFVGVSVNPEFPAAATVAGALRSKLGWLPSVYDYTTGKYLFDNFAWHEELTGNNVWFKAADGLGRRHVNVGFDTKIDTELVVVVDDASLSKLDERANSATIWNDGALAVTHVLVGANIDFPRHLTRNTTRDETKDTPIYKAYKIPTSKLPDGLLDKFEIKLTPSMEDIREMAGWLAQNQHDDDRLHEDQIEAVNVHLSTSRGFVNALRTGDGKTISTLVAIDHKANQATRPYRAMVVLEAAVREQWESEAADWLNNFSVVTVASRKDAQDLYEALESNVLNNGKLLVLCSYTLTADAENEETPLGRILANTTFDDLVLDEGRTIRGNNKTSRALWKMRDNSQVGVVLCATPVLKSVQDLGALMAWARNDKKITGKWLSELFDLTTKDDVQDWFDWWGPTLVRSTTSRERRSQAMATPAVATSVEFVTPTAYEVHVSTTILGKIRDSIKNILDTYKSMGGTLTAEEEKQLQGTILSTQSVARMAASDVRILAESDSAIAHLLRSEGALDFPAGFVPAKMASCVKFCANANEPVVVFTDYQQTAKLMAEELEKVGVDVTLFVGNTGTKKRASELQRFVNGDTRVLIATSAAERGLNLQNAKTVIHYDHKFTPDAIFQRTGRITRIGSAYTDVEAKFMVTENTIDERVFSVAVARAGLAGVTASKGVDDFAKSDAAIMLRTLVQHANPLKLANLKQASQLELTEALVA